MGKRQPSVEMATVAAISWDDNRFNFFNFFKGVVVYYREGGFGKSWWGVVIFPPTKEGGLEFFFDTLERILQRIFQNFLWGRSPRPPSLHYYLENVILVSFTTLKTWEDTDPQYLQAVGEGGVAIFRASRKGGL